MREGKSLRKLLGRPGQAGQIWRPQPLTEFWSRLALASNGERSKTPESGPRPVAASLDDAVAFIELAGYPHVLAREAYALARAERRRRGARARRTRPSTPSAASRPTDGPTPRPRGCLSTPPTISASSAASIATRHGRSSPGCDRRSPTAAPASRSASWSRRPSRSIAIAARKSSAPRCGPPTPSRPTAGSGSPSR